MSTAVKAVAGRPAELGALTAGGIGSVVLGLGVQPGLAAAVSLAVGIVPGVVTGLINTGGLVGFVRSVLFGRKP